MPDFEIISSKTGFVKLSDGTVIHIRVVIIDIVEGEMKPVGPDLQVGLQISFLVKSPLELREKMKDKSLPPSDGSYLKDLKMWNFIEIVKKDSAVEECLYEASNRVKYKVSVEVDVTIVARTLEYRDANNNPIYHFRWSPCIKINLAE